MPPPDSDDARPRAYLAGHVLTVGSRGAVRVPPAGAFRGIVRSPGFELAPPFMLAESGVRFRPEREPADAVSELPYRMADFELASRLSFFLWSSVPDDTVLDLAPPRAPSSSPEVLSAQVQRMLAACESRTIPNFAGQWLQLRSLKSSVPNSGCSLTSTTTRAQASGARLALFASVVHRDCSARSADGHYTFVNERLARHYGHSEC